MGNMKHSGKHIPPFNSPLAKGGLRGVVFILFFILFLTTPFSALLGEPPEAAEKPKAKTAASKNETPKGVKRMENMIAVFDLEITEGVAKGIARPLTDSIRREIVMSGRYEVVERGNMNKVLGEQKFQLSGCVAGECIVEAGQLLGAGKLITGSIGLVGKTYYLSLSLIDVETGKIENSSEDKCKCEIDELIDSTKRLVHKLLSEKASDAKPVKEAKTAEPVYKPSTPTYTGKAVTDSSGMEFISVKGGCYQMGEGSSYAVHEVCVDDFYIGKYEVTQGQWKAVMGNNPSYFKDCGDNCPVEEVSWNDIQDFITKLNNKTGKNYRLPTEAEWEYAARSGGKDEKYAGTSNESELGEYAWYDKNSGSKTHPVGQKKPNGLGLYDMSGNVWEWVNDWYDSDYYKNSPKNNPTGPSSGKEYKVHRGGSWLGSAGSLVASSRDWNEATTRDIYGGFRLVSSAR
jgi:formylglycine-generating enzyme required for sulfatase activity